MKTAIRYFSKSKKGNTKKLARHIEDRMNLPALDISNPLEEEVDVLLLVNAMYAANIDNKVKEFLIDNKDKIKMVVNINSSASGSSTYKKVKEVCDKNGINLSVKEYHTKAPFLFLNRKRPNEEDIKRLDLFLFDVFSK